MEWESASYCKQDIRISACSTLLGQPAVPPSQADASVISQTLGIDSYIRRLFL